MIFKAFLTCFSMVSIKIKFDYFFMQKNRKKNMWKSPKNHVFCIFLGWNLKVFKIEFKGSINSIFKELSDPVFWIWEITISSWDISRKRKKHTRAIYTISLKHIDHAFSSFDPQILSKFSKFYVWYFSLRSIFAELLALKERHGRVGPVHDRNRFRWWKQTFFLLWTMSKMLRFRDMRLFLFPIPSQEALLRARYASLRSQLTFIRALTLWNNFIKFGNWGP